ncbi:Uncharacterised protein [Mycobacterium tuberculosis]|nr:Uncharacterised protein [Mycobacterium tuberculosis]
MLPKFKIPDVSGPTLRNPELPRFPAMFQKPDPPEPTFPKPDVPPVPLLKKPDDGVVVEFPKPGVPAISIGMLIGPRLPDTSMPNGIAGSE